MDYLQDKTQKSSIAGSLPTGSVFSDQFEILGFLSSGGMGSVYKVRHLYLNKVVALKVLHLTNADASKVVRRFQQEAQTLFSLTHVTLVKVFDMGKAMRLGTVMRW